MEPQPGVTNNEAMRRYELRVDGRVAFSTYERDGERIAFLHTEVPADLEGRGVGSALARAALDDARKEGLVVVPRCRFIRAYIGRHPEYLDLVEPEYRALIEDT